MKKANDLIQQIEIFNKEYPRPRMNLLKITGRYDIKNDWPNIWPDNESPGIYILLDEESNIHYIGKSSVSIGSRLSSYFFYGTEKEAKAYYEELNIIRYIWTISVPFERAFEVSSIEEYLIQKLNPPINRIGKH